MSKAYHLTRVFEQYGWDDEAKTSRKLTANDKYDPMVWDDFINNIGYLVEGHKGQELTIKIKMVDEKEETE